jgi:hypothetical protein
MEKKISPKIQKKLDNIIKLKAELENWEILSEDEVFKLVMEFEKTPRDEGSYWYDKAFTDSEFAKTLIEISKRYESNTKMNVYIISSLGSMIRRYKLEETDDIYQYFLDNLQKKGCSVYVSLFITEMKHFSTYSDKWSYILSIKEMKPAKIAESSFESVIKREKENIPREWINLVQIYFKTKAENANNEYGKKYYLELIEALKANI